MFFDGSRSWEGAGVGCVLIDLEQSKIPISCCLEFECTNNTREYEALVQDIKKAIDLKVKCLKVFGDVEIIIWWVRNTIHFLSPHINAYQQEVWNIIYSFEEFNITSIPHNQNIDANILAK